MGHVPHDLQVEFSADRECLNKLKLSNGRFQALSDRYDVINKEIDRLQSGLEPAVHERLESLKKQRLQLLDQVANLIATAKAG